MKPPTKLQIMRANRAKRASVKWVQVFESDFCSAWGASLMSSPEHRAEEDRKTKQMRDLLDALPVRSPTHPLPPAPPDLEK